MYKLKIEKLVPIKKEEISKFLIISLMMILTIFVFSTQRIVKDTLIVSISAELISAIKLWGVLPSAIIVMLLYAKLCDKFKKTTLFHIFNVFFLSYFGIFTFIIHPNISKYNFILSAQKSTFPKILYQPIVMLENWPCSLYYIFSELWGSVMLTLMFWQTANRIFDINQAKRLYPLFGLFGQFGMLMSDNTANLLTKKSIANNWQESLNMINLSVIISGVFLSLLFFVLFRFVVKEYGAKTKKNKTKISFYQSLKCIFSSKYLALISIMVMCYGVSINLVEGVWKAQVRLIYTDHQSYASFMGRLQGYTGKIGIIFMGIGSYVLKLISWRLAALLTPITIFLSGGIFYIFSIYQQEISAVIVTSPMVIAVIAGFIQNIMSKSMKYAFFDATKEIAYIPLSEDMKSKGKAAVDIIGGRLGKSGGAMIQFFLLLIPGSNLINISPILSVLFFIIMIIWLISVNLLSREFIKISQ